MEGCNYEVFLSFRGLDTRTGFTDHLYTGLADAGVRMYRDEGVLRVGEEIGLDILGAIEQSKISIPIFSKNYASSPWCLKELAQMVECRKRKGQVIMPIFYDVEPSEVRYQTGGYGEALLVHENKERVDDESIRKWRAALNEVGGLKGWNRKIVANGHEGQLIKVVVTMVLSELKKASLVVSDFLVGVDDYVKEVEGMIGTNIEFPQGNEGGIDYSRSNDDQLMKIDSLPDGWSKIGKIVVSSKKIGEGCKGTLVYEGKYDGRLAAVKRLVRGSVDAIAYNEIDILMKVDRPENIVRYYGVEENKDFVFLALELCTCNLDYLIQNSDSSDNSAYPRGPASTNIKLDSVGSMMEVNLWQADNYPSPQLMELMRGMVLGLIHLHDLGIIHRDLKPQNVLITMNKRPIAQLSDMGISRCLVEDESSLGYHSTGCGTSGWRAPEVIHSGGRQTRAMDLFSLGCVLFFCITRGKHSFGDNVVRRDSNILDDKKDLSLVEFIPEAHDLILRLLQQEPKLRPKASEVLHHPFFWSSKMRLTFLHDISDEVESEARKGNLDLPNALENIAQLVFNGKWDEKIDKDIMDDLRRHRRMPYDGSCVRDLLRVVRNKFNHLRHAPEEVKEIHGSDPDGLYAYFAKPFPRLLIESYIVVSQVCRREELIAGVLSK